MQLGMRRCGNETRLESATQRSKNKRTSRATMDTQQILKSGDKYKIPPLVPVLHTRDRGLIALDERFVGSRGLRLIPSEAAFEELIDHSALLYMPFPWYRKPEDLVVYARAAVMVGNRREEGSETLQ
ncbi:MAG: hypothetical protein Q9218_005456 [Villophora microphyllina]